MNQDENIHIMSKTLKPFTKNLKFKRNFIIKLSHIDTANDTKGLIIRCPIVQQYSMYSICFSSRQHYIITINMRRVIYMINIGYKSYQLIFFYINFMLVQIQGSMRVYYSFMWKKFEQNANYGNSNKLTFRSMRT